MTISRRRASGKKQARRYLAAAGRRKVVLKGGYELIPTEVMKQLSESGLPADKREYEKRLNELLRGVG
jgi:hypothetical protein